MRAPSLWIPPAQIFEEELPAECLTYIARTAREVLPSTSPDTRMSPTGHIETAALGIIQRWELRSPETAVPAAIERHAEYDGYFSVRRLRDIEPMAALGDAAIVSYYRLLRDLRQGSSLEPRELAPLDRAFATLFALLGVRIEGVPTDPAAAAPSAPAPRSGAFDALARWRLGHHAFFVLIQALMVLHRLLATALSRCDVIATAEALALATQLWEGTAAAFRHAGDFTAEDYENIVRPSMSPPCLKDGFSGFFSSDHVSLIRILKGLRPALQRLPPELGAAHRSYLHALDVAYEAHAFVCEVFVGNRSSLRGGQQERAAAGHSFIRHTLKPRTLAAAGQPDDPG